MNRKIEIIIIIVLALLTVVFVLATRAHGEDSVTPIDNDCLAPGQVDEDQSTDDVVCVSPTASQDTSVTPTNASQQTNTSGGGVLPPTFNTGGDGLSDHRSDGRSSCPQCTQAPVIPSGAPATGHALE